MDIKNVLIVAVVLTALGYATGRYLQPAKIETKIQEVVKEVEVVRKDVVVVTKEVKTPDGTVITETRTEDKSSTLVNKDSKTNTEVVVTNTKPQWKAAVLGAIDMSDNRRLIYGVSVERRIVGPVFVGIQGYNNNTYGLSAGFEF